MIIKMMWLRGMIINTMGLLGMITNTMGLRGMITNTMGLIGMVANTKVLDSLDNIIMLEGTSHIPQEDLGNYAGFYSR